MLKNVPESNEKLYEDKKTEEIGPAMYKRESKSGTYAERSECGADGKISGAEVEESST